MTLLLTILMALFTSFHILLCIRPLNCNINEASNKVECILSKYLLSDGDAKGRDAKGLGAQEKVR